MITGELFEPFWSTDTRREIPARRTLRIVCVFNAGCQPTNHPRTLKRFVIERLSGNYDGSAGSKLTVHTLIVRRGTLQFVRDSFRRLAVHLAALAIRSQVGIHWVSSMQYTPKTYERPASGTLLHSL